MKRHALFVGVDDYADSTIQNLGFPSEDANELASVFRRLLKFDRVKKLVNPDHAPAVVDAVKDMTRGLGPGDLFLFFFAGHGFRVKENHVLVCAKDEYADLVDEYAGLPVGLLKRRMRGPWNRMLVLDACQNDIRATRGGDAGATARDLELIHTQDGAGAEQGFQIVVTSCSEGQKALEVADLGHGLFTSAFLDSVTTFADERRRIDLESLRADLGSRMGRLIGKYRLSGEQMPLFTMPPNAAGIVLLDGAPTPPAPAPKQPGMQAEAAHMKAEAAHGNGDAPFLRAIQRLCATEKAAGWSNLYVGNAIPQAKAHSLVAHVAGQNPKDDDNVLGALPIALCDCTLGGSGKHGFLFTRKGVVISGDWSSQTRAACLTWQEFAGPDGGVGRSETKYEILVHTGQAVSFNWAGCGRKAPFVEAFFKCVRMAAAGADVERTPEYATLCVERRKEGSVLRHFWALLKFVFFGALIGLAIAYFIWGRNDPAGFFRSMLGGLRPETATETAHDHATEVSRGRPAATHVDSLSNGSQEKSVPTHDDMDSRAIDSPSNGSQEKPVPARDDMDSRAVEDAPISPDDSEDINAAGAAKPVALGDIQRRVVRANDLWQNSEPAESIKILAETAIAMESQMELPVYQYWQGPTKEEILNAFAGVHSPRFWTGKAIPASMAAKARDSLGTGSATILALFDSSPDGDASIGFAATSKGIFYRNPSQAVGRGRAARGFVPWDNVWDENLFVGTDLLVGGVIIYCPAQMLGKDARKQVLDALAAIALTRYSRGDE